jgi:hypothetical protein
MIKYFCKDEIHVHGKGGPFSSVFFGALWLVLPGFFRSANMQRKLLLFYHMMM